MNDIEQHKEKLEKLVMQNRRMLRAILTLTIACGLAIVLIRNGVVAFMFREDAVMETGAFVIGFLLAAIPYLLFQYWKSRIDS